MAAMQTRPRNAARTALVKGLFFSPRGMRPASRTGTVPQQARRGRDSRHHLAHGAFGAAILWLSLCGSSPARAGPAEDAPASKDDIVVYGRALRQVGRATSGSQGVVGYADFEDRPISRVGELAENVPGLIADRKSVV